MRRTWKQMQRFQSRGSNYIGGTKVLQRVRAMSMLVIRHAACLGIRQAVRISGSKTAEGSRQIGRCGVQIWVRVAPVQTRAARS